MKTYEEIYETVKDKCPEMLSNDVFMHDLECRFGNSATGGKRDIKTLSNDEYAAFCKVREDLCTATVGQVIKHLQDNFKPTDKVCYMDCVEGYKNDCTYMTKNQLGNRFFKHVKRMKDEISKDILSKEDSQFTEESVKDYLDDNYPYVNDNDVIVY